MSCVLWRVLFSPRCVWLCVYVWLCVCGCVCMCVCVCVCLCMVSPLYCCQPSSALLLRRQNLAAVQAHYFSEPPQIERGWRQHLVDTRGRAYLDVVNNVAVLGHCHPAVLRATTRQLSLLNTNSRFVYAALGEYAERIVKSMPAHSGLDSVFFVNSGSESVDLALRLARTYTGGRRDILCLEGGYHGVTTASSEISTTLNDNPNSRDSRPPYIHLMPMPNLYRGRFTGADREERYVEAVRAAVQQLVGGGGGGKQESGQGNCGPACFIAESLVGNAGGVELPPGYLRRVYEIVRAAGGVCIADEVQIGLGRLGSYFWGFQEHGVTPDIVTMAKAAGNGHPVGFVVTTKKIAEAFSAEGTFFSSAGGNPVSCAVGSAVLDTIRHDRLQENAKEVGAHLSRRFGDLLRKYPHEVGMIHGHGLYQGVEIVRNGGNDDSHSGHQPATAAANAICDRLLELGVACHATGDYSNVLKCKPPLCITRASADFFVDALDQVLRERVSCCNKPVHAHQRSLLAKL